MAFGGQNTSVASSKLLSLVAKDPELSIYEFVNRPNSELCESVLERTEYDVERAEKQLKSYFSLRKECEMILQCYTREALRKAAENRTILLVPGGPSAIGTVIIFRVGAWDPLMCSIQQISALLSFVLESVSLNKQAAHAGFSVIFDLKGISLRQLSSMSPSLIKRLKTIANVYLPIQCLYQLVTNAAFPKVVSVFFALTSFIKNAKNDALPKSEEELQERFGSNFVSKLPIEYGGRSLYDWEENMTKVINSDFDKLA